MIKHILVPLDGAATDERALNAAFTIAKLFHGHVDALHIRPDPRIAIPLVAEGFSSEMLERLIREAEQADQERASQARRSFDRAITAAGVHSVGYPDPEIAVASGSITATWREVMGQSEDTLVQRGRCADLILFAQTFDTPPDVMRLETALFETGQPILLAAPGMDAEALSSVAIAWNGSRQAARAIAGAMPLLRRARTATLLTVAGRSAVTGPTAPMITHLSDHLAWHGISVAVDVLHEDGRPTGELLADRAKETGAGLLVMGGYGHSRFREMVLGGATRYVLETALGCSVLMAH
ncbi:universal stress protein [Azospirillum sp. YIM B02556]|uniref:Universal stress protein n=1 Tax=Azospirillum endophyticum TaxID=2800326 RepID=A0ABS1FAV9_9PROT|nr:universal stress protein [Azospirillum endophyticum]MBK1840507.1 universal stress protein [Azospirillum endophyticum]